MNSQQRYNFGPTCQADNSLRLNVQRTCQDDVWSLLTYYPISKPELDHRYFNILAYIADTCPTYEYDGIRIASSESESQIGTETWDRIKSLQYHDTDKKIIHETRDELRNYNEKMAIKSLSYPNKLYYYVSNITSKFIESFGIDGSNIP